MWVQVEDYEVDEDGFVGLEEGEYVRLRAIEQAAREVARIHYMTVAPDDESTVAKELIAAVEALRTALDQA
jgi:long-subunit acyl-CoA synthetase (AMP-forming)